MAFLFLGIALLLLKMTDTTSVAGWSWWLVLSPFGLAVAWWSFADSIGLTQRRAMDKMEQKKADRRTRNLEALGLGDRRERKARHAKPVFPAQEATRPTYTDPTTSDTAAPPPPRPS